MARMSRRQSIRAVIAAALATASSVSLIDYALAKDGTVTVKTKDGRELEITSTDKSSVVRVMKGGSIVDAKPSETFTLANGQTLTTSAGTVTGGSSVRRGSAEWASFALMPQELRELQNSSMTHQ